MWQRVSRSRAQQSIDPPPHSPHTTRRRQRSLGITLHFEGQGLDEVGAVAHVEGEHTPTLQPGQTIVRVTRRYYRPAQVTTLLGDPSKPQEPLGWTPHITAQQRCIGKVHSDWLSAHNTFPGSPRAVPQPDLCS